MRSCAWGWCIPRASSLPAPGQAASSVLGPASQFCSAPSWPSAATPVDQKGPDDKFLCKVQSQQGELFDELIK